jgi:uncharacterized protein
MLKKALPRGYSIVFFVFLSFLFFSLETYSQSGLYRAVTGDNISRARRALTRGANPNGDGNPQQIPIIAAAELNYYHMIVLLAENNANINIQNHIGFTPLMEATIQRNNRIMSYLVSRGARLEIKANNGATALMIAVNAANLRGARLLLEAGANPNVFDNSGITPLMRAMEMGDNVDMVKLLVEYNADMEARNPEGAPVLMVYPYRNRFPAHRELINLGANVNIQDYQGRTPLIKAVMEANMDMIRFLISKGADRYMKDHSGTSAVDYGMAQMEIRQFLESLD